MKSIFCIILTFLLCSEAFAEPHIESIEVLGAKRVEKSTILLQISSEIGTELDSAIIESDIKEIYRTGLFEQVTAKIRLEGNNAVLIFQVLEKPAIRMVYLKGNKEIDSDDLKEKLGIGARRFLDRKKIAAGIEEAKAYYQSKGYYGTEIEYITTAVEENQVDLTFTVTEGEEKKLREIVFEGNLELSDDELSDEIETATYKWWSSWLTGSGVIKKDQLENDVRILGRHYLNKGYVDVQISDPIIEETEKGLRLTFQIKEGVIYHFAEITVEGDLIENSVEKTLENVESKEGEIFSIDKMRKDAFLVSEKFTDIGYAFANVQPDTNINRENKTVGIVFKVNKGSLVQINRINISGNEKTLDNVIRRSLKIQERELFSSSKIRRSEEILTRLGYFDEVTITPDPSRIQDEIDLTVAVREGQTGTFSAGAGISSGEGFIFNIRLSERNLLGRGYSVALQLDTGTTRENYVLSFDNPRVNDTHWSFGVDLLAVEREFDDFDRNQAGGSVSVGYPLWFLGPKYLDDVRFSLAYELLRIEIDEVEKDAPQLVIDQRGTSTSSSITPRLIRSTIDNPLNPSAGSRQRVSLQLAGIGGDQEFWLAQASNTFYYPLLDTSIGKFVFSHRVKFGYGDTFNGEDFPLFRRFFPGGIDTVRGFESRELGPKDEEGNEYGGNKQLISNVELIFPLFTTVGFRGLVFYDVGNAFDDEESIDFGDSLKKHFIFNNRIIFQRGKFQSYLLSHFGSCKGISNSNRILYRACIRCSMKY